jgi:hypothetical protein
MRSPPPEVLKTWPKPNYIDPITRGSTLMIVELTLLPIAMIVVFLRMWVRVAWLKKAWYDDYLMLLAMVCTWTTERPKKVAMLTPTRSSALEQQSWSSWHLNYMAGTAMCGTFCLQCWSKGER